MARPNKPGLEYFPLDCVMDDKSELIEAKYGIVGFGVIIKLFQKIYSQGYYYKWGEEELLLFSKRLNVDINLINNIINDCLRWGLFKKYLYEEYGVLTSRGIQKRYIEATFRRKEVEIEKALLVTPLTEKMRHVKVVQSEFMYTETPANVDITLTKTPQSKVKESKVKESINDDAVGSKKSIGIAAINFAEQSWARPITEYETESIIKWCKDFSSLGSQEPDSLVIESIKRAISQNVRTLAYVSGILRDWFENGINSIEGLAEHDQLHQRAKEGKAREQNHGSSRKHEETQPRKSKYHIPTFIDGVEQPL